MSQQVLSCTLASTTTVTSVALFGSVVAGMQVTGTGIPNGTTVSVVASTSSLTISQTATVTGASTLTFYALDAPVSDTEFARFINEAIADVWALSGGRPKTVASATAWTTAQTATGQVVGILTDVEDIVHCWASTTSGSVGVSANDVELDRVELSYIMALRADGVGLPTYLVPKCYAISRKATVTPASVNLLQLDYWPSVTGYYLPIMYVPQFSEIDSAVVTTPDLNDLESRDAGLICAARVAQMVQRNDLVPGILADVSNRTAAALDRKLKAMLDGKQDGATAAA